MNKKLLVTGINGFIGSNCAKYFAQFGYEIFGIDIFGEQSSNFIQGEVDLNNLQTFAQKFDVIIHLAGSGTVGVAQKCPEAEYTKTVGSTKHLLEFMKNYNPEAKLIYSSSAAVYGDQYNCPIKETDKLNPISIYGKHKVEVERMCEEYNKDFGLNINIIRFFSIYGNGLKKQLLWDFCNRIIQNSAKESLPCFGTGKEKRDFVNIQDALDLINLLLNNDEKFNIVNCGTGLATTVNEVLNLIKQELNYAGKLEYDNITKQGDPESLIANIDKAKWIGFNSKIKTENGIKQYVEWFKENN